MQNIDKFNYVTGRLFADLYEVFPSPLTISGSAYLEDVIAEDDENGSREYYNYFRNTITWLAKADYIDLEVQGFIGKENEYDIVLSEKGLQTMKAVPESLSQSESFGEMLLDSSKKKAVDKVVDFAGKALSYGASVVAEIS